MIELLLAILGVNPFKYFKRKKPTRWLTADELEAAEHPHPGCDRR